MSQIKYIICSALAAAMLLQGCSNFDAINSNPDAIEKASSSMICTGLLLGIAKYNGGDEKSYYTQNALPKYLGYANEAQIDRQYNKIGSGSFSLMIGLPNIEMMLEYAKGSPMENSYQGIAKFYRAYAFFRMTMQMGDIPYSETGQGASGNYTPVYDTQETVFKGILDDLTEADRLFGAGVNFNGDPTALNGNAVKWRGATNALALRVLMSLSKKENLASLDVKKRFADIVAAGNLFTAAQDFFGVEYSSVNRHPSYTTNNMHHARVILTDVVVSQLKHLNDRRLFYFGEPIQKNTPPANSFDSYAGVSTVTSKPDMDANYKAGNYSGLNQRYMKEEASESYRLLTYAEQQLTIAEAIVRGWVSGNAEDYYKSGVKAALTILKDNAKATPYAHGMAIDQAYIDGYFTDEAAFKATTADRLKQIWQQRWLLNFMQDPEQSFFEYRRTGYPEFPIDPAVSMNSEKPEAMPVRYLYSSSEASYNKENMEAALTRQFGSNANSINSVMWVLK